MDYNQPTEDQTNNSGNYYLAEMFSKLIHDSFQAKSLLQQVNELKEFDNILLPGERQSIWELIKVLEARIQALKEVQKHFIN